MSKENTAVAFQRSTMRATHRARGITSEMWRLVHPACGGARRRRATDPIRRHVPVAMARRVGSRTVLCLRKSIFDAEFFRGTYFCTLLPGSQVRLAWKYLAVFLLFFKPATNLQPSRSFPALLILKHVRVTANRHKCNWHIGLLYETRQRNEPLRIDYLIL